MCRKLYDDVKLKHKTFTLHIIIMHIHSATFDPTELRIRSNKCVFRRVSNYEHECNLRKMFILVKSIMLYNIMRYV